MAWDAASAACLLAGGTGKGARGPARGVCAWDGDTPGEELLGGDGSELRAPTR